MAKSSGILVLALLAGGFLMFKDRLMPSNTPSLSKSSEGVKVGQSGQSATRNLTDALRKSIMPVSAGFKSGSGESPKLNPARTPTPARPTGSASKGTPSLTRNGSTGRRII